MVFSNSDFRDSFKVFSDSDFEDSHRLKPYRYINRLPSFVLKQILS